MKRSFFIFFPLSGAAPLLCAGVTTFTPYRLHHITAEKRVAVVGLGGLGHLAVKWGIALGCPVTGKQGRSKQGRSDRRSREGGRRKKGERMEEQFADILSLFVKSSRTAMESETRRRSLAPRATSTPAIKSK